MVDISQEAPEQTESRRRAVVAMAQLTWHSGAFAYSEFPASAFPTHETGGALALARDEEVWSVLKAATADAIEPMALFFFPLPGGRRQQRLRWLARLTPQTRAWDRSACRLWQELTSRRHIRLLGSALSTQERDKGRTRSASQSGFPATASAKLHLTTSNSLSADGATHANAQDVCLHVFWF